MFRLFSFLARFAGGTSLLGGSRFLRGTAILALVASVVTGLCNTALLAVINRRLATEGTTPEVLAWSFAGLCLLLPVTRFLSQVLLVRLGQGAVLGLRLHLARRLLDTPFRQLEKVGPARLFTTLTDDVASLAGAVTDLPLLAMHLAIVLSCLIYLGYLSWIALLILLVGLAAGVVSYQVLMARAGRHFDLLRQAHDALVQHFTDLIQGNKELKLHRERREAFVNRLLTPTADSYRRHQVAAEALFTGILAWGRSVFFVILGAIVFVLPRFDAVSAEVITGYTLTLLFMIIPLETAIGLLPDMGRAWVSVQRIEQVGFSLTGEASVRAAVLPAPSPWSRLELRGLGFHYTAERPEESFSLGPLDLSFRAGELVFLIGGNGSGKTTLAKLLTGLYAPDEGELRVDGEPVDGEEARRRYRQGFSAVFSDFHLFDRFLGLETAGLDERARAHLEALHLSHKVRVEGGRLSTLALSQGQRKRLALLLAWLEDRPSLLFDEWAADQDHEYKRTFYREILPGLRARGRSVFVITHDDHYFEAADRIVKLEQGRVIFDGSPADYQNARLADWSAPEPRTEPLREAVS